MRRGFLISLGGLAGALLSSFSQAADLPPAPEKIEVRVVVVTTWEVVKDGQDVSGELFAWRTRWPLTTRLAFPLGVQPLAYDPKSHVLAIVTGMATARAAASIVALGSDPRFDLRRAYWIIAGTAGVDPAAGSAGSAAWARTLVDGDLAQSIDEREAPAGWPDGVVPYQRTAPDEGPPPPGQTADADVVFTLNRSLVDWAYRRTRDIALPDDGRIAALRAPYQGPGGAAPVVFEGDGLMSARTWYGERLNAWARRWVSYWTRGEGRFAMSAEEDTGILEALSFLHRAGLADLDRVLSLRAASDYTVGPPGVSAAEFLAREARSGFPATPEALDALYRVGSPVVRALADDWSNTKDHIPGR